MPVLLGLAGLNQQAEVGCCQLAAPHPTCACYFALEISGAFAGHVPQPSFGEGSSFLHQVKMGR